MLRGGYVMSFELRLKTLFAEKKKIQELELENKKLINKLSHELQLLRFAERRRKILKNSREILNRTRKLIESI